MQSKNSSKSKSKRKVLITGASGFIGTHLSKDLISRGLEVYLFDTRPSGESCLGRFIKGDIRKLKDVKKACLGMDGVIHLAAVSRVSTGREFPRQCIDVNVMGAVNILESIRLLKNKPWLILGSTREVKYDWERDNNVANIKSINNLYGKTKFIAELLCSQYAMDYNMRTLVLRFGDVYGSALDNKEKVVPKLILQSLNNKNIFINNPNHKFKFIHYSDLLRGIYSAIRYLERKSCPFFKEIALVGDEIITLKELVKLICKEAGSRSNIVYTSENANVKPAAGNSEKSTKKIISFKTKTPLQKGIKFTIETLRES